MNRNSADFERDGVAVVRQLLSEAEVRKAHVAIGAYIRNIVPTLPKKYRVFEEDEQSVRQLFFMNMFDPFFQSLAEQQPIRQTVRDLVSWQPRLYYVETFNKPARVGSAVPPHQDNYYLCMEPPEMVTVWIAMDAASEANGGVHYLRGSHKRGLLPHSYGGARGSALTLAPLLDLTTADIYSASLQPGDALIHDCLTIHYSPPNTSEMPRCGLAFAYISTRARLDRERLKAVEILKSGRA